MYHVKHMRAEKDFKSIAEWQRLNTYIGIMVHQLSLTYVDTDFVSQRYAVWISAKKVLVSNSWVTWVSWSGVSQYFRCILMSYKWNRKKTCKWALLRGNRAPLKTAHSISAQGVRDKQTYHNVNHIYHNDRGTTHLVVFLCLWAHCHYKRKRESLLPGVHHDSCVFSCSHFTWHAQSWHFFNIRFCRRGSSQAWVNNNRGLWQLLIIMNADLFSNCGWRLSKSDITTASLKRLFEDRKKKKKQMESPLSHFRGLWTYRVDIILISSPICNSLQDALSVSGVSRWLQQVFFFWHLHLQHYSKHGFNLII